MANVQRQILTKFFRIFVCAIFLGLAACGDDPVPEPEPEEQQPPDDDPTSEEEPVEEPAPVGKPSMTLNGQIFDEDSGDPLENVQIIGFDGGTFQNNEGIRYGDPVVLGKTDKCGRFEISMPDSIKGLWSHGGTDTTTVQLKLKRDDFGSKDVYVPFQTGDQTFEMKYAPDLAPYFSELYAVLSEDEKSVTIGWDVHSLFDYYKCANSPMLCRDESNGSVAFFIGEKVGEVPITVNEKQTWKDEGGLPASDFRYTVFVGDSRATLFNLDIKHGSTDTVFAVKRKVLPVLNHCE